MNIYKSCPTIENKRFLLRTVSKEDIDDLFLVYADKNALPFFNSDNCDGDNFFYDSKERMRDALAFWELAYQNGWFVRLSILDKERNIVIGTIELCLRVSNDDFNDMGILRVDVRSDYETSDALYEIFSLITPNVTAMVGGRGIITKAPIYAVERIKAIAKVGFKKSAILLEGKNGYKYDGYWVVE